VLAAGHSWMLGNSCRLCTQTVLLLPLLLLLPTCELTFSLVGSTVRPVAAQFGTCRTITTASAVLLSAGQERQ
jgi:hypothetical protein